MRRGRRAVAVCLVFLACFAAICGVCAEGFWNPVFGIEDPSFYSINSHLGAGEGRDLLMTAGRYAYVWGDWYRPTQFHLAYYLVTRVLDWHDHLGFKIVNWLGWAFLGTCLCLLVTDLFPGDWIAGLLAALFLLTHPAIHTSLFWAQQFDWIHMVLMLLTLILYRRHLAQTGGAWCQRGSVLCFLAALTSKEPAMALPFALFLVRWVHGADGRWMGSVERLRREVAALAPYWISLLTYVGIRFYGIFLHPSHADPDQPYAALPRMQKVAANLWDGFCWVTRTFNRHERTTAYVNGYTLALGLAAMAVALAVPLLRPATHAERTGRRILVMLLALFSLMPVLAGHMPRHFALPVVVYSAVVGLGVSGALRRGFPVGWGAWAGASFCAGGLVLVGHLNLRSFLHDGRSEFPRDAYAMHESILRGEFPIDPARIRDDSYLLIDDEEGLGSFAYGAGSLFRFMYLKPLREQRLQDASGADRATWLASPVHHAVRWEREPGRFADVTGEVERRLREAR